MVIMDEQPKEQPHIVGTIPDKLISPQLPEIPKKKSRKFIIIFAVISLLSLLIAGFIYKDYKEKEQVRYLKSIQLPDYLEATYSYQPITFGKILGFCFAIDVPSCDYTGWNTAQIRVKGDSSFSKSPDETKVINDISTELKNQNIILISESKKSVSNSSEEFPDASPIIEYHNRYKVPKEIPKCSNLELEVVNSSYSLDCKPGQ
jgi:hypothetical protein